MDLMRDSAVSLGRLDVGCDDDEAEDGRVVSGRGVRCVRLSSSGISSGSMGSVSSWGGMSCWMPKRSSPAPGATSAQSSSGSCSRSVNAVSRVKLLGSSVSMLLYRRRLIGAVVLSDRMKWPLSTYC